MAGRLIAVRPKNENIYINTSEYVKTPLFKGLESVRLKKKKNAILLFTKDTLI